MYLLDFNGSAITRSRLWQGSVIGTLAELVGGSGSEQRWERMTYLLDNMSGWRGAIYFGESETIGAFFAADSSRNPFPQSGPEYEIASRFAGMPDFMWHTAYDNVLHYLNTTLKGETLPVITAAIWSEGDFMSGSESWSQMYWHGAALVDRQIMPPSAALAAWKSHYTLTDKQITTIEKLFLRRMADAPQITVLQPSEWHVLMPVNSNYIDAVRTSLRAIGFRVP